MHFTKFKYMTLQQGHTKRKNGFQNKSQTVGMMYNIILTIVQYLFGYTIGWFKAAILPGV